MSVTIKTRMGHFLEDVGILLDVVELKEDENPREYFTYQIQPETSAVTVRCDNIADCMVQLARMGCVPDDQPNDVTAVRHVKHPSED